MEQALEEIAVLKKRAAKVGVYGKPRVQPRLAHGARSRQPAHRLRSRRDRAALERKESRGGHFRDDYPEQGCENGRSSTS